MLFKKNNYSPDTTVCITLTGIDKGHYNTTYRGVKCLKSAFDYVIYQILINEIKPDLIIEIGTSKGGSTLYFADLLELIGKGEIHTIDIEDKVDPGVKSHKRIKFFSKGWENYDLKMAEKYQKVMVIEDSSHKYEDTLKIMKKFSRVITVGSYMVVEDGIINELGVSKQYNGGPVKAIIEFLTANKNFEIATQWTDFFGKNATFNTIGYLKKLSQ